MGEKGRLNAAIGILGVTGALVVYSAIQPAFTVPEQIWGIAIGAATYFFSTAKRKDDDDE